LLSLFAQQSAVKADKSIMAWGDFYTGGTGAPHDRGYTKIYSTGYAFAALKADGSITACHAAIDPSALRAAKAALFE
jgi:hypothetical protein